MAGGAGDRLSIDGITAGFLSDAQITAYIERGPIRECSAAAGDSILMRPLLLHGSRKAERPTHRRVAHFEFACEPLPAPLLWRRQP